MTALQRWLAQVLLAFIALQGFFVLRIAALAHFQPESTTFQRSEAWALHVQSDRQQWQQQWLAWHDISDHLKRAVIAAEDSGFLRHQGIEWQAMERAWQRNMAAEHNPAARIRGASTLTQQLAKNILLSDERTLLRKIQELLLTMALEQLLSKQRILEIYLNSVEWGRGIFGAQAAASYYFGKHASQLSALEAAQLAALLPAPQRFQQQLHHSPYLAARARSIRAGMRQVQLPLEDSRADSWH